MNFSPFLSAFPMLAAMGLAGGLHCAGMCGGLTLLATGGQKRGRIPSLFLFLIGKGSTYVVLGALAGALGEAVIRVAPLQWGARILAFAGAALLVAIALQSMGWLGGALPGLSWFQSASGFVSRLASEGWTGKLLLGGGSGLLPCPMVYAFLAIAATMGSPIGGAAAMAVLGVTSALPLIVVAFAGYRLAGLAGRKLPLVSAALILIMAVLILYRGVGSGTHHHMH